MPAPTSHPMPPLRYTLGPGQALRRHAARGTVLHVAQGRVKITLPPQWAAVGAFALRHSLTAGDVIVVSESGWIIVSASGAAEVMLHAPGPGAWQRLWNGLLARLHRRQWQATTSPVEAETR
ncbi:hypothetical protein K2O51_25490 [Cupriavidus pinatubonensis]|uniref:hypothetical protein n=1 Tax=Cupriavidus pinatubonensis TaxID=248026 RepID=UPI0011260D4B|nr:hypothetical protein [Cupriavidus pinatubonensis]QYY30682.1 hypothetical protein K2O51_25490 [Cupriavidus pinatubonensis]